MNVQVGAIFGASAAVEAAAAAAADVDEKAKFPVEAVAALKEAKLLSCSLPRELGGRSTTITELAQISRSLGAACSSAGMVFAMHHTQALSLTHHAASGPVADLTASIAESESLLASATTEISTGGDVRSSTCAVEFQDGFISLRKNAPVISYGAEADYICATARRDVDSPPSDQVLVICPASDTVLEQIGTWDVLGFRGTCSPGYLLTTRTHASHVVPVDYATISSVTMLPSSHTLWASVWLGIADAALAKARAVTRAAARKSNGGVIPQSAKLADLFQVHQTFESLVSSGIQRYEQILQSGTSDPGVSFAIAMNNLKLAASTAVLDVVVGALRLIGIDGYREDHPSSLGRLLRDAFAPQLMVSNDRIRASNAQLILAHRG